MIKSDANILSVSQFLDAVNLLVGGHEAVVQGEVFGWNVHPTGIYFSLKDKNDGSIMDCYLYPALYHKLGVLIEDGMEIRVTGIAGVYKPKGRFSFRVRSLELAGEGSLKKAYELLKKKLGDEGLFVRKRPLPEFISKVGLITSKSGAAVGDFRKNLLPLGIKISLYDARVEGVKAVDQIVNALGWFNSHASDIDVLVIIRGGGSLEDLQAFNDENVARAVFACPIPTIAGIGHERDVSIVSLVADAMSSTPTAAAMLVNRSWDMLVERLPSLSGAMMHDYEIMLDNTRGLLDIDGLMSPYKQGLVRFRERLESRRTYLLGVSPERNLKLGYSIVTDATGHVIRSSSSIRVGDDIAARFAKGRVAASVTRIDDV